MAAIISNTTESNRLITPVRLLCLHLMSFPTATSALAAWISARGMGSDVLRAEIMGVAYDNAGATRKGTIATRHVRLVCGSRVLSEATIVYRAYVLPDELRHQLETTDRPFGAVVEPLGPFRRTTLARVLPAQKTLTSLDQADAFTPILELHADGFDGQPWPHCTGSRSLYSGLTSEHGTRAGTRTRHAMHRGGCGDMRCWLSVQVRDACC